MILAAGGRTGWHWRMRRLGSRSYMESLPQRLDLHTTHTCVFLDKPAHLRSSVIVKDYQNNHTWHFCH